MWQRHVRVLVMGLLIVASWAASLIVAGPVRAQSEGGTEAWQALEQRPGAGEQCLVCRQRIHGDDVVEIRYKGRTFFVAAKMLDDFEGDPDAYFSALQVRSAWFDERAHEGRSVAWGWVAVGCYVLLGLVFAALCGFLAIRRALSPLPWFFVGLVGNVAALVVLLVSPRGDPARVGARSRAPMACPACGLSNHPSATACGHCRAVLEPTVQSDVVRSVAISGSAS